MLCVPQPAASGPTDGGAVPSVVRRQDSLTKDLRRLERHDDIGDADTMIGQRFFATLLE